jgi:hypothetical protein
MGSVHLRFRAAYGRAEKMAPKKHRGTELSVFKGREAKLNRGLEFFI